MAPVDPIGSPTVRIYVDFGGFEELVEELKATDATRFGSC